jgi:hypothetical protein
MVQRSLVVAALAAVFLAGGLATSSSTAHADKRRVRRSNLPAGWKWPPSRDARREGRKCMRDLRKMGIKYKRAPRRRMIATPVIIPAMKFGSVTMKPTYRKPPFVMDCRLARAFATYAQILSTVGISELYFSSIYDYRRVRMYHKVQRALSRHSLGLAIDIFAVGLENGTKLTVSRDYWTSPALMVAELALRSSGGFRQILSPAIDPISHTDHLHLEVKVEQPEIAKSRSKKARRRARSSVSQLAP